jgi:hypothetical protein
VSSFDDKFVTLSELDLTKIFWPDPDLRLQLQLYALPDFPSIESPEKVSQSDVGLWLSRATPGTLITSFLTDIGGYSEAQRRKLKSYSRSTWLMSAEEMRSHLRTIRKDDFHPKNYTYTKAGYVLRGSFRTDGFRLQVLGFKMNELHSVKFRHLSDEKLPPRLTSTIGGTDYFLTEIRNVVSTGQDVTDIWGCSPDHIKILGIDLGQAFVVGASALLPPCEQPDKKQEQAQGRPGSEGADVEPAVKTATKFFNLAVKQKAVYQPTFKHRRWLEHRKQRSVDGSPSISQIESSLPPRHGSDASFGEYARRVVELEEELQSFYGNTVLKKHKWNAQKARVEEYRLIANRLLQLVGGSMGAKREESNRVVIGVGLGKFSSKIRLSSLHESFQSYFVQRVSQSASFIDAQKNNPERIRTNK